MYRIISGRSTGKTSQLMLIAKEQHALFICSNPSAMIYKAHAYGIAGIDFISYEEFFSSYKEEWAGRPYVIDEIELAMKYCAGRDFIGYTLSNED